MRSPISNRAHRRVRAAPRRYLFRRLAGTTDSWAPSLRRLARLARLALLAFGFAAAPLLAQSPGAFDFTFGVNGKEALEPWSAPSGAEWGMLPKGLLGLSNGSFLAYGTGGPSNLDGSIAWKAQIARFTHDGALDLSFGVGGYAQLDYYCGVPPCSSVKVPANMGVAEAPTGQLWLTVDVSDGSGSAGHYLYRLLANGTLDTSFGSGGEVDMTYGAPGMTHHCQGDLMKFAGSHTGKLLALCRYRSGTFTYANRLLRINSDGTVDTAFGSGGTADFGTFYQQPGLTDFVELADGSVAGTGPSVYGGGGIIICKLRPDGLPDTAFGYINGCTDVYWAPGGGNVENGYSIVADGQRLVVLGYGNPGTGFPPNPNFRYPYFITRVNADGSPDLTFGTSGSGGRTQFASPAAADAPFPWVTSDNTFMALARQQDGRFVAVTNVFRAMAGGATTNPAWNVLVTRFNNDGSIDSSYATGGQWYGRLNLYTRAGNFRGAYEQAFALMVQPEGKLVVAGQGYYDDSVNLDDVSAAEQPYFLFRLLTDTTCFGFTDVSVNDSSCGSINWMKNRSITLGCAPGQYCPTAVVPRNAMAAFLNRLGIAMTPIPIDIQRSIGAIAINTTPFSAVLCAGPLPTAGYARDVVGSWRLSALAEGALDVSVTPAWSVDGGLTWAYFWGSTSTRVRVPGAQWSQLSGPINLGIPAGSAVQLGLEVVRTKGTVGATFADSTCQMTLQVINHN